MEQLWRSGWFVLGIALFAVAGAISLAWFLAESATLQSLVSFVTPVAVSPLDVSWPTMDSRSSSLPPKTTIGAFSTGA